MRHAWDMHHNIMHVMHSCSCYLSTWHAYARCHSCRLHSCWGIMSNAVCDSNRNNKRDRPLLPRAPTYHACTLRSRFSWYAACVPAATLNQMQYAILIASSWWWDWDIMGPSNSWPLGIIPSSPRPLDPSGPQSLFLILTTRLRYIINLWEGPCNGKW